MSILTFSRTPMVQAESRVRTWVAPIKRLSEAVTLHTEGVRTQVFLAFTLSFVVTMAVGLSVLSHGGGPRRGAPTVAQAEPTAGVPTVTRSLPTVIPHAGPQPTEPSVALPSLPEPSKRADEEARLVNASPAGGPQVAGTAVRSSGSARIEVAKVTEIALWGSETKPWVSISSSAPVRYQLRNVSSDWVVIDISRAHLALTAGHPPAGRGLVKLIRAGQFAPDVVRVVLELTQAVPVHIASSPGKNAIVVSLAADAGGSSHPAPSPRRQPGAAKPLPMARVVHPAPGT